MLKFSFLEEVMDIDLVRTLLLLFLPSSCTTLSSLLLSGTPSVPSSTAIQLRLTVENTRNSFSLSPRTIVLIFSGQLAVESALILGFLPPHFNLYLPG